jgi:hypothetical protein
VHGEVTQKYKVSGLSRPTFVYRTAEIAVQMLRDSYHKLERVLACRQYNQSLAEIARCGVVFVAVAGGVTSTRKKTMGKREGT